MDWIWDVDKRFKVRSTWMANILMWYIDVPKSGQSEVGVMDRNKLTMIMFRGTEEECQEYIDEHTK